ncbi:SepM family pheromone-processing serine protease [Weissella halotolerans]|nr:SepM family pheromone-processing serine protease [Weissella halotolerans]
MRKVIGKMARYKRRLTTILVMVIAILLVMPLPFYAEQVGTAENLTNYIKVDHRKPKLDGQFMLTSVSIAQLNGLALLTSLADPTTDVMTAREATGGSGNMSEDQALNRVYMQSSINEAKANAYRAAHVPYERLFKGIYVMGIQDNSHFKKSLSIGDTVTAIDKQHFDSAQAFQKYIRRQPIGTDLTISYLHDKAKKEASGKTVPLAGTKKTSGIGIALTDDVTVKAPTRPITADLGEIGGPSGGLMFALEMYDALSKTNLAQGRKIAGTGTIDQDGQIGEIGGIDKKVLAAKQAGVKIFLAPYIKPSKTVLQYEPDGKTNYQLAKETARKYAPDMKIVPIKTFQEAITYLERSAH